MVQYRDLTQARKYYAFSAPGAVAKSFYRAARPEKHGARTKIETFDWRVAIFPPPKPAAVQNLVLAILSLVPALLDFVFAKLNLVLGTRN